MLNAEETKTILNQFAWECYEFWANELDTDDDKDVWPKVIKDLESVTHNPFTPCGDLLDVTTKTEIINQLKHDLNI